MNEYNEIINKLNNMGIYCWIENGQVTFNNISICAQNENTKTLNNKKTVGQEYNQECDEYAWINRKKRD